MSRVNTQQVGRAGELYVAAEIHRRGAYAVTFPGNMPRIDLLASNVDHSRRISVQVKTTSASTWHAQWPTDALETPEDPSEASFWIFVDLGRERPMYYIARRSWVRHNIWQVHTACLERYERQRGFPRESPHHGIPVSQVELWRDRWDLLGIF
jgi:hypothetical protein